MCYILFSIYNDRILHEVRWYYRWDIKCVLDWEKRNNFSSL